MGTDPVKEAMKEVKLPLLCRQGDGRLWRSVPNRRWYNDQRGETPGSEEVALFHRKADATQLRPQLQTEARLSPQ
jgi:hypothetical protein